MQLADGWRDLGELTTLKVPEGRGRRRIGAKEYQIRIGRG